MMHPARLAAAGLALALAGPATSQTAAPSTTQDLNATVQDHLQDQQALNAANQAIYQADTASDQARYDAALAAHDRAVDRSEARYQRQQRAYADAVQSWRLQVRDCLQGHKAACDSPAPDPAAFY